MIVLPDLEISAGVVGCIMLIKQVVYKGFSYG